MHEDYTEIYEDMLGSDMAQSEGLNLKVKGFIGN